MKILLGSEKFQIHRQQKYSDALLMKLCQVTNAKLINTYGPTETAISCNMKDLTHAEIISFGRLLLNVTEFVVDSDGNELPLGIVGELYIGGAGVANSKIPKPPKISTAKFQITITPSSKTFCRKIIWKISRAELVNR